MTAATACRTCGTEPREGARFCDVCGSLIAPVTERAEYRQVTVRATAVVKQYGGTVDKFTADGTMPVFGAPVALEDHALRACLAALGVQEEAKDLGLRFKIATVWTSSCAWA